jgi:glutamine amidotransferase
MANNGVEHWVNVPTNSILTIHRQTVMVHPIIDKYYARSPHHIRSSIFVQTKGLVSNEKNSTTLVSVGSTPYESLEVQKRTLAPMSSLSISLSRSRTPEQSSLPSRTRNSLQESRSMARPIPPPPMASDVAPVQPAQGNIKKKRKSLNELEQHDSTFDNDGPPSPELSAPARTEYGNPNKIAQYFPELRLS